MQVLGDRYELGEPVGDGGMSSVLAATDRLLERQVAVKLMRPHLADDPVNRQRFLREARTAAQFNHPNAVAVYDSGEQGGRLWIVMELVPGESLAQRLAREGALQETEALRITDAVLAALAAAHDKGIVHRDVKPDNVLLPHDGDPKLADFGIAKALQEATGGLTQTGTFLGTAKYLPPEQVQGEPTTPASDVYGMGVVLFEMLAGVPPFDGDEAIQVALAHSRQALPDITVVRDDLSPAVLEVLDRALAKDPADRYPSAHEMRAALRLHAGQSGGQTLQMTSPAAVRSASAPTAKVGRRPLVLAAAGLLTALALITAVLGDTTNPPEDAAASATEDATAAPRPAGAVDDEASSEATITAPAKASDSDETPKAKRGKGKGRGKGKAKGKK